MVKWELFFSRLLSVMLFLFCSGRSVHSVWELREVGQHVQNVGCHSFNVFVVGVCANSCRRSKQLWSFAALEILKKNTSSKLARTTCFCVCLRGMNTHKFMAFRMVLPYSQLMVDGCFGAPLLGRHKTFIGTNLGAKTWFCMVDSVRFGSFIGRSYFFVPKWVSKLQQP